MIIVVATSDAASSKQCKSICKAERQTMINQCIDEEGKYWDGIEEPEIHRQCDFLTYYSYVDCVEKCINPNKDAIIFYDKSVKNFPLENMSAPIDIDEGESIPPRDSNNLLQLFIDTFIEVLRFILIIVLYLTPSLVVGWVAYQKGYEKKWMWFAFFSVVFTPILGFLAVIATPSRRVRYVKVYKG